MSAGTIDTSHEALVKMRAELIEGLSGYYTTEVAVCLIDALEEARALAVRQIKSDQQEINVLRQQVDEARASEASWREMAEYWEKLCRAVVLP